VLFGIPVMTTSEGIGYADPERDGATPWVALGPTYVEGAPHISNPGILPMRPDEPGEVVFVSGSVTSTQGRPLAGAVIDIWQNDKNGKYSSMTYESAGPMPHIVDLSAPEYNLRGKITTDGQGRYAYRTILPGPEILTPLDGALGKLLTLLDRSISRPLHIHSTIRADGFRELTHQILFDFDPLTEHASEGPVDPRTIFTGPSSAKLPCPSALRHVTGTTTTSHATTSSARSSRQHVLPGVHGDNARHLPHRAGCNDLVRSGHAVLVTNPGDLVGTLAVEG
jgi:protocatechuate 3,4-dioxygenase beta subunit